MAQIVIGGFVLSLKKINETTHKATIADTDLVPFSGPSGTFYYSTFSEFKDVLTGFTSGFQGALSKADTPTNDGIYIASESGTYTHAGNIVVDLTEGITLIVKSGTAYTKVVIPVNLEDYVLKADIINSINSSATDKPLSAAMGRFLADSDVIDWGHLQYPVGQYVFYNGSIYKLNSALTPQDMTIPPNENSKWELHSGENIANANLTFDADRTHDLHSKKLIFTNGDEIGLEATNGARIKSGDYSVRIKSTLLTADRTQLVQDYAGETEVLQAGTDPTIDDSKSGSASLVYGTQKFGRVTFTGSFGTGSDYIDIIYGTPFKSFSAPAITPLTDSSGAAIIPSVEPINSSTDPEMKLGFRVKFKLPSGTDITNPSFYYVVNGY